MAEDLQQDPKDQVNKIYEDEIGLIVSPLTYEANAYYGDKTPWYDEGWTGSREFYRRFEDGGRIYYIIDKRTGKKESLYKDKYGDVFYDVDEKMTKDEINDLVEFVPGYKKIILDIVAKNTLKKLRDFAKSKIDVTMLSYSDDLIYDIKKSDKHPGESIVILRFPDDDDLFNVLDLSDDDIWFVNAIMSRGSYEFTDGDRMWEDNKEGYGIFRYFNAENLDKLKQISSLVMPGAEFDSNNDAFLGKLFRAMDEHFDTELQHMTYTYIDEFNEKSTEFARKEIEKEFNKYFVEKGFILVRRYDTISTTVAELIYLYVTTGMKSDDLKTLLENVLKPEGRYSLGGWSENQYEYEARALDDEYLNREFERYLDKILDKLYENDEMQEYFKLYEKITSKFRLGTWYTTPKDKNILFMIRKIDPASLKLEVVLRKSGSNDWDKTHWFTEENFNKFLHQPELFSIFDEK